MRLLCRGSTAAFSQSRSSVPSWARKLNRRQSRAWLRPSCARELRHRPSSRERLRPGELHPCPLVEGTTLFRGGQARSTAAALPLACQALAPWVSPSSASGGGSATRGRRKHLHEKIENRKKNLRPLDDMWAHKILLLAVLNEQSFLPPSTPNETKN